MIIALTLVCSSKVHVSRVTFTTYSSHTAHHDNSGPPVTTCLKFRGLEPVSLNAASPTVLHTSGTVSTSRHHWQPGRHCKHFQKEAQNVLLHWLLPVDPRDLPRLRFVILMTDTWRVKPCIIIIIIIVMIKLVCLCVSACTSLELGI